MTTEAEREIALDLSPNDWPMLEQLAYREKVGVNAQYALLQIGDALTSGDPDSDEPPAEMFNIPPAYLIGFVWITQRRDDKALTFASVVDSVDYVGLVNACVDTVMAAVKEDEEPDEASPLASPAKKPSSPRSKPASPRAKSSAGRSKTSKP